MSIADKVLRLLYPPKCAFCRKLIEASPHGVCPDCMKKLPYAAGGAAVQKFPFVKACTAPFYYENEVRDSLLRYKFGKTTAYASIYAKFLRKSIDENLNNCDIITWVPLSRRRLRQRGYDQARLICEETAKLLGTNCMQLLRKKHDTPAQSRTGGADKRRANISGVYEVIDTVAVENKDILLIDDIVTTGSTFSECARMLLMAGAKNVYCAAVARHRD